jgi:hypothetical protein
MRLIVKSCIFLILDRSRVRFDRPVFQSKYEISGHEKYNTQ